MAHYYAFDAQPHVQWITVLCLVALIPIVLLFYLAVAQSRRSISQQSNRQARADLPPSPVGVCQRCRSAVSYEAAYCGRCGLPVTRPVPLSMPTPRAGAGASRWLLYVMIGLLGAIGIGAFFFMSHSEPQPAPPIQQHAPRDAW